MKYNDRIYSLKDGRTGRIVFVFDFERVTVLWDDKTSSKELFANLHLTPVQEMIDIVKPLKTWLQVYFELSKKDITIVLNLIQIVGIILAAILAGSSLAELIHWIWKN